MKLTALLSILLFLSALPGASAGDLQVGTGCAKITPPLGAPMAGYYFERAAEGVHDDLLAKSIVLEKDGIKAALVALDLIGAERSIVEDARALIEKETGIPGGHVMISATHAHTGPVLRSSWARTEDLGGETDIARKYSRGLPARILDSVRLANEALGPAKASAAIGEEGSLSFNRRFHMADGTVGWNPGKLNPKILRPAGPIDPAVPVLCFSSADGKPLALYVNYAMHLDTVGGLQISADYPYTLAKLLGEVKGPEMRTVFTIGTAGNTNHVNVSWADPQKGHAEAARIGTVLAAAVIRTFPALQTAGDGPILCRSETVKLALPEVRPEELEAAKRIVARRGTKDEPSFLETVSAYKAIDVSAREGKPLEAEVQAIALGSDVAWVALPGEIFVELGLAIKRASPFRWTAVVELANGSIGYVPTRQAYVEGNYEPLSARCAAGSGELLVETAARLLLEMHRELRRAAPGGLIRDPSDSPGERSSPRSGR